MLDLLFGPIISLAKTLASGWMGNIKAKQQLKAAVVTRKLEMIADTASYNEQWELAALQDSDRWIKRLSFLLLSAPLVTSIFLPAQTQGYITHILGTLPVWYTTAYMGMLSSIWAVKSLQSFRSWKRPANENQAKQRGAAPALENTGEENNNDRQNSG